MTASVQPCPKYWPLVFASIPHGDARAAAKAWKKLGEHVDNCPACQQFEQATPPEYARHE